MRIGITIGDPAGIGPEIILKSLEYMSQYKAFKKHRFVIAGGADAFFLTCGKRSEERIKKVQQQLSVRLLPHSGSLPPTVGEPSPEGGNYAFEAIHHIYQQFVQENIDVVVTGPIDKKSLKLAGVEEVDHTRIFRALSGVPFVDTLFKTRNLYIYFYSKHIPFHDIAGTLNQSGLHHCLKRCLTYNRWLGLAHHKRPLAVAALNPHAGDANRFGREETEIITPVVQHMQKEGYPVTGPVPADSVFALAAAGEFSSVLSLYHDQGHIAAKTLDFHRTVSLSPGMPFLRTSVDHGTAMDIAGQNKASAVSMVSAIKAAIQYGPRYARNYQLP